jgi:hypothetical protein
MTSEHEELKEYAGGWLKERKGTDVPPFLKLAFPIIGICTSLYIVVQMMGDVGHATRGKFVQQFNKVSVTSPGFQYFVFALAILYVIVMLAFVYRKFKED